MPISDLRVPADDHSPAGDRDNAVGPATERAQSRATAAAQSAAAAVAQQQQMTEAIRAAMAEKDADLLATAIRESELESEAAERRYADAWAAADGLGVAKAQREMADISYRRGVLQDGLNELRPEQPEASTNAQPPQLVRDGNVIREAPQPQTVEDALARMDLLPSERDYLRRHPDALTPQNIERLRVAYNDAQRMGVQRGSKEYFRHFDGRLGYAEEIPMRHLTRPAEDNDAPAYAPRRQPRQDNGGVRLKPGQVMLTAEQRAHARAAGIDDYTYALGVKRLMEEKQAGNYPMREQK
jgi:hypothetical protein